MQIQRVIEQLGYSSKEAKIYLAALHLGEAHISEIAAKVKMPRSTVQEIVDKLHKDGLMKFYVMRRYKYWMAENPEKLLANLQNKEELMKDALPELISIQKSSWSKSGSKSGDESPIALFCAVADTSSQPVLITNNVPEIQYVNQAWEKQFGYKLKEVRGENPRMLQSGQTPRYVYEKMWKALKSEKMFQSDELIDKKKDGTFFNLLTTIIPLRHMGQVFYAQILDDITERKRVEKLREQFIRANLN